MKYAELLELRHNQPVDGFLGRILDVGLPKKQRSPITGDEELVQDLQIEDEHRNVVVVQFYSLSRGTFTGRKDDRAEPVAFSRKHAALWIELWNTSKDAEKATLKRHIDNPSKKDKGSNWWLKKGVRVMLKATAMCGAAWLMKHGEQEPEISKPLRIREPKPLEVPGRARSDMPEPNYTKRPDDRRRDDREGNGRRDDRGSQRREEPRDQNRRTDQQRRQEQDSRNEPARGAEKEETPKSDMAAARRAAAATSLIIIKAPGRLKKKYEEAKVKCPDAAVLGQFAKGMAASITRFQGVLHRSNLSMATVTVKQLASAIDFLAEIYVISHCEFLAKCEKLKEPVPPDNEIGPVITTVSIASAEAAGFRLR